MVEGYTDVIAMHQSGLENVVANSGTALGDTGGCSTGLTSNITLLYDGDEAGIKASLRGVDMLLSEGDERESAAAARRRRPRQLRPQAYLRGLRNYIATHEAELIRFKTGLLLKQAEKDPVKKAELIWTCPKHRSLVPNEILRYAYSKEGAPRYWTRTRKSS